MSFFNVEIDHCKVFDGGVMRPKMKLNCLERCIGRVDVGHNGGNEGGLKRIMKVDRAECLCWILAKYVNNETGSWW